MIPNLEGVVAANWQNAPIREIFPGIRARFLWQGKNGAKAQVLEIDAGSRFTTLDVHTPGPEEVFVVSGVFNDGVRDYPAGSFLHNPAGSAHIPQSKQGCVIFVFFPEG
jgi:anti-sigma factor ChrR (cupin superfamily)